MIRRFGFNRAVDAACDSFDQPILAQSVERVPYRAHWSAWEGVAQFLARSAGRGPDDSEDATSEHAVMDNPLADQFLAG
jgi:hypothetical protein